MLLLKPSYNLSFKHNAITRARLGPTLKRWFYFVWSSSMFSRKILPIKNSLLQKRYTLVRFSVRSKQTIKIDIHRYASQLDVTNKASLKPGQRFLCCFLAKATNIMNKYVFDHSAVNSPTLPTRLEYSQFNSIPVSNCISFLSTTSMPGSTMSMPGIKLHKTISSFDLEVARMVALSKTGSRRTHVETLPSFNGKIN